MVITRSQPTWKASSTQFGGAAWVGVGAQSQDSSGDPGEPILAAESAGSRDSKYLGGGTVGAIRESKRLCACGNEVRSCNPCSLRCSICAEAHQRGITRDWKRAVRVAGTHCSRCAVRIDKPGCCDKCKAYVREWKKSRGYQSPGKRLRLMNGRAVSKLRNALLQEQAGMCARCGEADVAEWHLDHIVPVSRGGGHDRSNLQVLCSGCNLKKAAKIDRIYGNSAVVSP